MKTNFPISIQISFTCKIEQNRKCDRKLSQSCSAFCSNCSGRVALGWLISLSFIYNSHKLIINRWISGFVCVETNINKHVIKQYGLCTIHILASCTWHFRFSLFSISMIGVCVHTIVWRISYLSIYFFLIFFFFRSCHRTIRPCVFCFCSLQFILGWMHAMFTIDTLIHFEL